MFNEFLKPDETGFFKKMRLSTKCPSRFGLDGPIDPEMEIGVLNFLDTFGRATARTVLNEVGVGAINRERGYRNAGR